MSLMFPKPEKPVRQTAAARRHLERVAQLPCVICGAFPVVVHHCIHSRHAMRKSSDFDTIPLCPTHHDATSPDGLHHSPSRWRNKHGEDWAYLPEVQKQLCEIEARTIVRRD